MTTIYLSFASIAKLHDNNPLTISPIGELSNKARTYAKDPGVFSLPDVASETILYNFLSEVSKEPTIMPVVIAEKQIAISDWIYEQAKIGNTTSSKTNALNLLQSTFSNEIEIVEVGEMVTNSDVWMPSFIKGNHVVDLESKEFIIWLSDSYFRTQYPKVTFTVVHPIPLTEIDLLMTMNYRQIAERLAAETPNIVEERAHNLTEDAAWPYTDRSVTMFQIHDLVNKPSVVDAFWRVLSWGNGVDSEDLLFEQIQKEILESSAFSREDWEEKIPDLFNPLEFYAIPHFDLKGLANKTTGTRSNSPIVDRESMMDHVDFYLTPVMTVAHIIKSLQVVPFLYKSTQCSFVAKTNNREELKKIHALFPDYQLIPSMSPEFGLMNLNTLEFIRQMENLLAASEVVTDINLVPTGVTRIERLDKQWVAKRIGRVKVIVLTKWQMVLDGRVED